MYFSTSAINIITDVVILFMPIRAFATLNMNSRKRCKLVSLGEMASTDFDASGALLGIFLVGGIAVLASIVRLYALWVYTVTDDVSYDAIYVCEDSPLSSCQTTDGYADSSSIANRSQRSHHFSLCSRTTAVVSQDLLHIVVQSIE